MIQDKIKLLEAKIKDLEKPKTFRSLRIQKGYVECLGNSIYLKFDYDKKLIEKIKLMKGFSYEASYGHRWRLNEFDYHKAKMILNLNKEFPKYYWIIDPIALEMLQIKIREFDEKAKVYKKNLLIKKKKNFDLIIPELKTDLRPFQTVGVQFIEANNGVVFLADEMGLGKSIQSLAYTLKNNLKTVIICPKYLKYNWQDKIHKFSDKKALIYSKRKKKEVATDFDYIILSYGEVATRKDELKKLKYDCVIVDESHYMKTSKSARTKAVRSVFSKYKSRILLSGTPIVNHPIDFYEQFRFLRPDLISRKETFGIRFCDAVKNEFGNQKGYNYDGASNLKELYSLMQFFYIKRLKSEVLDDLPPKVKNIIPYEYSKLSEYKKMVKKLQQDNKGKESNHLVQTNALLSYLSLEKINLFDEFLKNSLEENPDGKIVIFTRFIPSQKKLWEKYSDIACKMVGGDSDKEREAQRKEFESNPDKKICIVSTDSATGFDLVSAATVFFLDLPWSPKTMEQAEDRTHRMGQDKVVSIYVPILKDTVEEYMLNLIEGKEEITSQITDGNSDFAELTGNMQSQVIASLF